MKLYPIHNCLECPAHSCEVSHEVVINCRKMNGKSFIFDNEMLFPDWCPLKTIE